MEKDVLITGFSNPTSEGITLHLNNKVHGDEFWVSWDKIGKCLFDGYSTNNNVAELNNLKKITK